MDIKELAVQAGFKVFGDRIIAADEGSSGLATESLKRFSVLLENKLKENNNVQKLGER